MNQKVSQFLKGKSFYIVLALITAFAAMASFFAITTMLNSFRAQPDPISYHQEDIPWDLSETPVDTPQQNVPKESSPSQSTSSSQELSAEESGGLAEPAELQPAQASSFNSPMTGAVLQRFSGDELVYNTTLRDWRTHNGLDIKGSVNANVTAPADATVTRVVKDAQWGTIVELTSGKLVMRLAGLKTASVKEGDAVLMGATVGTLGEIPCESALETHLHLEFEENGKFVNPANYFA